MPLLGGAAVDWPLAARAQQAEREEVAALHDLRRKRQQISAFLLRQGLHYPGERAWTKAHRNWLMSQKLEHAEHRIAFE
jgi:hypothetical protein